jgi:hypothetical protein
MKVGIMRELDEILKKLDEPKQQNEQPQQQQQQQEAPYPPQNRNYSQQPPMIQRNPLGAPGQNQFDMTNVICHYCNFPGHMIRDCKRRLSQEQNNNNFQPRQQYNNNFQPRQQYNNNFQPRQQYNNNFQPRQQYNNNFQPRQQYNNNFQPRQQYNVNQQPRQQLYNTNPQPRYPGNQGNQRAPLRFPNLNCSYCLRAGHLAERCFKKESDEKNGQLTPTMSSPNDTRVRFREQPRERINCIPLLGEGDVRRENISCLESPKPTETDNKMHHIKAIEAKGNKPLNVNWTKGLKIDITANRSDEYHKSITIESMVGDIQ